MKQRLLYLLRLYAAWLTPFVLMKPVFMLYNRSLGHFSMGDVASVVGHGFKQDLSTCGYLMALPLLLTICSVWTGWRKWMSTVLRIYYAVLSLLIAIVLMADTALYSFWQFKIDATIFNYLDHPESVVQSVSLLYLCGGIALITLLAVGIYWLLSKTLPRTSDPIYGPQPVDKRLARQAAQTLVLLVTGGLIFLAIRGGVGKSTMNVGTVYYSDNQFLNHSAVNPAFSLLASSFKQERFDKMYRFYPEKEENLLMAQLGEGTSTIDSTSAVPALPQDTSLLKTKRPDVLLIIMESFAGTFVHATGGPQGITPQFDRLVKQGVFFSHFYSNSFRTDRGCVCILSGYPSFPKVSPMKMPEKCRTLPSLARTLGRAGYETEFVYGGDVNFTNTKGYLLSTGYHTVLGDTHFPPSVRKTHAWGVTDRIVFDTLYQRLQAQRPDKPHFTTLLTLASHEPWVVPFQRKGLDHKANAMAYLDDCLGRFVGRLRKTPKWNNLVIICLPDHGINYPEGTGEDQLRRYHIPMLWLGGAVKSPRDIATICAQSDLAATLLGQLGLPHSDFAFSHDVMSPAYRYPYAVHTFDNGLAFIDASGYTTVDFTSGKVIADSPQPSARRLKLGKAALQRHMEDFAKR